jgi:hypothetical protein
MRPIAKPVLLVILALQLLVLGLEYSGAAFAYHPISNIYFMIPFASIGTALVFFTSGIFNFTLKQRIIFGVVMLMIIFISLMNFNMFVRALAMESR